MMMLQHIANKKIERFHASMCKRCNMDLFEKLDEAIEYAAADNFEYVIEARVTDRSRREIVGQGAVRVTRQRYYVHPRPERNLYRPGEPVTVNVQSLDANDQPIAVEGRMKVFRDRWEELRRRSTGRAEQNGRISR